MKYWKIFLATYIQILTEQNIPVFTFVRRQIYGKNGSILYGQTLVQKTTDTYQVLLKVA